MLHKAHNIKTRDNGERVIVDINKCIDFDTKIKTWIAI